MFVRPRDSAYLYFWRGGDFRDYKIGAFVAGALWMTYTKRFGTPSERPLVATTGGRAFEWKVQNAKD